MRARPQNRTLSGREPLDRPTASRPHRVYVAITNHCNRACPWCSTYSSPRGRTFIDGAAFASVLPERGPFEVQLEGGEPTTHPAFFDLVDLARAHPRCTRLVVVTNGARLPRAPERLERWLARLGRPLTIKLSINHHLLEHDPGLIELALRLRERMGEGRALVLNVRLRPGRDREVLERVEAAGLSELANVFHLQRYGLARSREGWAEPFVVGTDFTLVNPDGARLGVDLVARSEAMGRLP